MISKCCALSRAIFVLNCCVVQGTELGKIRNKRRRIHRKKSISEWGLVDMYNFGTVKYCFFFVVQFRNAYSSIGPCGH